LNEACLKVSCRFCRKPVCPRLPTGKSDADSRNISLLVVKVSHSTRIY
jgi:hypothetical protein